MKKLTVAEQEAVFTKDCKLINLQFEYSGFTGKEEWAIITELTEKELSEKFSDIIDRYKPFILLSMAQQRLARCFRLSGFWWSLYHLALRRKERLADC